MKTIDLRTIQRETIRLLQYLISVDTSRGNETILARHVAQLINSEGIFTKIYEPEKGRGSLVAHLQGGNKPALVLLSHLDTAPAVEKDWPFSPYSGEIVDGEVRGRGAIDCKGLLAVHVAVLIAIKRSGLKLDRDLYLVSTADEERGGDLGAARLLAQCPELRSAGYVLGEGGGWGFAMASGNYHLCQVGEKGRLILSVNSTLTSREILNCAWKVAKKVKSRSQLPNPRILSEKLNLNRNLANTVWGQGSEITFEILPGIDLETVFGKFTNSLRKRAPFAEIKVREWTEGTITDKDPYLYEIIHKETVRIAGASVVPYITPGYSDNRFFRSLGAAVFGYQPLLPDCRPSWIHGQGERLGLSSIELGIKLLLNIIITGFASHSD